MDTYRAICNLSRKQIQNEDADYVVSRSHLNRSADYAAGDEFQYVFESESSLWLKDSQGFHILVPAGEKQCFECR